MIRIISKIRKRKTVHVTYEYDDHNGVSKRAIARISMDEYDGLTPQELLYRIRGLVNRARNEVKE